MEVKGKLEVEGKTIAYGFPVDKSRFCFSLLSICPVVLSSPTNPCYVSFIVVISEGDTGKHKVIDCAVKTLNWLRRMS